ncbi:MAG: MarR family transcriptional regulator [Clostridia bacterium]|nr:MarR family transcriptional regulator [Clostridia bacterium]
MSGFDPLKLENQLCFPLYVASKEVIRLYHAHLAELDLTYTQYIALMVLWEEKSISVKALGEKLFLDTGTLTPLLKSMENKGLVTRRRSDKDERSVTVSLTDEGLALREKALCVPAKIGSCIPIPREDAAELYRLLYKLISALK